MASFMFFSHHAGRCVEKIDDGHTSNKQESGHSSLLSVCSKKMARCVWLLLPGIIDSLLLHLLVPSSWQRRRRRRKSYGWRRVREREGEKKVHRINEYGKEGSSTKYHLFFMYRSWTWVRLSSDEKRKRQGRERECKCRYSFIRDAKTR